MLLSENRYGRKSRNLHSSHFQMKTAVLMLLMSTQQSQLWEQLGAIHYHSWKECSHLPFPSFQWAMGIYCNSAFPSNVPGKARRHIASEPLLLLFYLQRFSGAEGQQKGREVSKAVVAIIVQWLGKDSRGSFGILKCTHAIRPSADMCFRLAACKGEEILNWAFFFQGI